jgi:Fe-S-cluster containining protein
MDLLSTTDPKRAAEVRNRARQSIEKLTSEFPGDPTTGILSDDPAAEEAFAEFGNDELCPALDPVTGACDVYPHRPMTCRVFGPPLRTEEGLGHCELCFQGATVEEVVRCEMVRDPDDLETVLLEQVQQNSPQGGDTLVCFVLAEGQSSKTGVKSKARPKRSGR